MTNLKTVNTHLEKTLAKVNEKLENLEKDLIKNHVTEQDLEDMYANERKIKEKILKLHDIKSNTQRSLNLMKEIN